MKKFKKKFLLTGLALAVPLVGAIASACSEVSQDGPTPSPGGNNSGQGGQNQPGGSGGTSGTTDNKTTPSGTTDNKTSSGIGSLENLPMFFLYLEK